MPRELREHYEKAFYHVMVRGNARERIFFTDKDRLYFLKLLKESFAKYATLIHAYCLMENHVHLLVQVGTIPLGKAMHNLNFRFAMYINNQTERVGHLFQGRYKAILVNDDEYLKELIRYIHLNPLKARIVETLDNYVWSSHNAYLGKVKCLWLTTENLLKYFEDDMVSTELNYERYVEGRIFDLNLDKLPLETKSKYERFVRDTNLSCIHGSAVKASSVISSLDSLASHICSSLSLILDEVQGPQRKPELITARFVIIVLARYFEVANTEDLSKFFDRDRCSLFKIVSNNQNNPIIKSIIANFQRDLLKQFLEN